MSDLQGFGAPPQGGPGQQPPAPGTGQPGGLMNTSGEGPDSNERLWGLLAHLSFFVLGIIGPIIVMMAGDSLAGHPSGFLKHHGKQALIWQVAAILIGIPTCGIGSLVMMVWAVLAALAANKGEWYTYPGLARFAES